MGGALKNDKSASVTDPVTAAIVSVAVILMLVATLVTCVCCNKKRRSRRFRYSDRSDTSGDQLGFRDLVSKPALADPESVFSEYPIRSWVSEEESCGFFSTGDEGLSSAVSTSPVSQKSEFGSQRKYSSRKYRKEVDIVPSELNNCQDSCDKNQGNEKIIQNDLSAQTPPQIVLNKVNNDSNINSSKSTGSIKDKYNRKLSERAGVHRGSSKKNSKKETLKVVNNSRRDSFESSSSARASFCHDLGTMANAMKLPRNSLYPKSDDESRGLSIPESFEEIDKHQTDDSNLTYFVSPKESDLTSETSPLLEGDKKEFRPIFLKNSQMDDVKTIDDSLKERVFPKQQPTLKTSSSVDGAFRERTRTKLPNRISLNLQIDFHFPQDTNGQEQHCTPLVVCSTVCNYKNTSSDTIDCGSFASSKVTAQTDYSVPNSARAKSYSENELNRTDKTDEIEKRSSSLALVSPHSWQFSPRATALVRNSLSVPLVVNFKQMKNKGKGISTFRNYKSLASDLERLKSKSFTTIYVDDAVWKSCPITQLGDFQDGVVDMSNILKHKTFGLLFNTFNETARTESKVICDKPSNDDKTKSKGANATDKSRSGLVTTDVIKEEDTKQLNVTRGTTKAKRALSKDTVSPREADIVQQDDDLVSLEITKTHSLLSSERDKAISKNTDAYKTEHYNKQIPNINGDLHCMVQQLKETRDAANMESKTESTNTTEGALRNKQNEKPLNDDAITDGNVESEAEITILKEDALSAEDYVQTVMGTNAEKDIRSKSDIIKSKEDLLYKENNILPVTDTQIDSDERSKKKIIDKINDGVPLNYNKEKNDVSAHKDAETREEIETDKTGVDVQTRNTDVGGGKRPKTEITNLSAVVRLSENGTELRNDNACLGSDAPKEKHMSGTQLPTINTPLNEIDQCVLRKSPNVTGLAKSASMGIILTEVPTLKASGTDETPNTFPKPSDKRASMVSTFNDPEQETQKVSDDEDYDNPWDNLDEAVKRASIKYLKRPSVATRSQRQIMLKSAEDLGRLIEMAEKRRNNRLRSSADPHEQGGLGSQFDDPRQRVFTRGSPMRHTVKGIFPTTSENAREEFKFQRGTMGTVSLRLSKDSLDSKTGETERGNRKKRKGGIFHSPQLERKKH